MAEYENRERNYNNGIAKILYGVVMGAVLADSASKDAYVERQIRLMNQEKPNAEFMARTTLIGLDQALETRVSIPKLALTPSRPYVIKDAKLTLDMSVSASTEDALSIKSDTEVEGEGQVGFGVFSASMRIKAAVSVAKEQKRASDYSSTTHVEVTMGQGEAPEGLMKIIDSLNATTVKALELNASLIEMQYRELVAASDALDTEPEAA